MGLPTVLTIRTPEGEKILIRGLPSEIEEERKREIKEATLSILQDLKHKTSGDQLRKVADFSIYITKIGKRYTISVSRTIGIGVYDAP